MTSTRLARRGLLAAAALTMGTLMASVAPAQESGSDKIIVLINPNSNAETTASMTEIAATATGGGGSSPSG